MLQRFKNHIHKLESAAMARRFGHPGKKLVVVGVTGTDGKTTTATLIHHILTEAGIKACLSSTLMSPHTTTPGRGKVQKFLQQGLKNGCTHAVLEVTSIAVDQHRVWGIPFEVGVLTNIANNEHLDYHGSFEHYRDAKVKFITSAKIPVANADDPSFSIIKEKRPDVLSFSLKDKTLKYETKLQGEFNTYNILAAITACRALGIKDAVIAKAISTFEPPSGRLEIVVKKPFTVVVDFAHTPQAFEKVLPVAKSLKQKASNKLIHVFGATGDRDKGKRPIMAKFAATYDDYVVLTHEDTYAENKEAIIAELEAGLKAQDYRTYAVSYDRKEAIKMALEKAKPGDVVILTGVGHQKSLNVGGKEVPWSDQNTVKELLQHAKKKS